VADHATAVIPGLRPVSGVTASVEAFVYLKQRLEAFD